MRRALILLLLSCVSCAPPVEGRLQNKVATESDEQLIYRDDIAAGRYHSAYLRIDKVLQELKDVDEGAVGVEYDLLWTHAATNGQSEWIDILCDARIPLDRKIDLVSYIHEIAVDLAEQRKAERKKNKP